MRHTALLSALLCRGVWTHEHLLVTHMVLKLEMVKAVIFNDVRAFHEAASRTVGDPAPVNFDWRLVWLLVTALLVIGAIAGGFWWKEREFMKSLKNKMPLSKVL